MWEILIWTRISYPLLGQEKPCIVQHHILRLWSMVSIMTMAAIILNSSHWPLNELQLFFSTFIIVHIFPSVLLIHWLSIQLSIVHMFISTQVVMISQYKIKTRSNNQIPHSWRHTHTDIHTKTSLSTKKTWKEVVL